jgi:DNA repair/transcription protein MET18/MMS19
VLRIPQNGIDLTKQQIFQPVDPQTEEGALAAMQVLINTIYVEEEAAVESDEDIQGLARDACQECINILKEPEKSQAKPATKVLCAFISTTRRPSFRLFLFQFENVY